MQDPSLLDKLPVFTTPVQQITFYADDPSSYQQLISIINPYDFFVKFKISSPTLIVRAPRRISGGARASTAPPLATAPIQQHWQQESHFGETTAFASGYMVLVSADGPKYTISHTHGTIQPNHKASVTLQHIAVNASNIGVTDKIRVQLYNVGDRTRVSGKRDLSVVLLDSAPKERLRSHEVDRFQQLEASSAVQGQLRQQPLPVPIAQEQRSNNKVLYIAAIVLGILVLAMPKEGDANEYFPNILPRPTSEMKQMACFLLGILCTLLFQS